MSSISFLGLSVVALGLGCVSNAFGQPAISAVRNGASFDAALSAGALASVFGQNLSRESILASTVPLPQELGGVRVFVKDVARGATIAAPLYFVSDRQINFQIPFELDRNNSEITVAAPDGVSQPFPITLASVAPGIFSQDSSGRGQLLFFDSNFKVMPEVVPGRPMLFYATGLGRTEPPGQTGHGGASTSPLNVVASDLRLYVGGQEADILWAGLAPGFVGVYQINAIPRARVGTAYLTANAVSGYSVSSNVLSLPNPQSSSSNVTGLSGSVEMLYPTGKEVQTFSPLFVAAKIRLAMNIKPDATPFAVKIRAGYGESTIDIDPGSKRFVAKILVPSPLTRAFDFTGVDYRYCTQPLDFSVGCTGSGLQQRCGSPFPGPVMPLSRQNPTVVTLLKTIPYPSMVPTGDGCFMSHYYVVEGTLRDSKFAISEDENVDLAVTAGFVPLPYPQEPGSPGVTVVLSVDGQDIATGYSTCIVQPRL